MAKCIAKLASFFQMIGIIAGQQNEIAGMQTENCRILDILLNQQGNGEQA
jgi:hypothetical protein